MIDIQRAKNELVHFVEKQKIDNPRAPRKLEHIMRVAKISRELATNLQLTKEQIDLAELIGLLHDIGRFKQYEIFDKNTTSIALDTSLKFDHGEAGVEILKKDDYIRKYIEENKFDAIILTAVKEHNGYELTKGLTKEEELFCRIIKDSDKLDLMYEAVAIYWQEPVEIEKIESGKLSEQMLKDFYEFKLTDNRNRISKTDQILRFTSFVFDLNFPFSFSVLKEKNYINQMIDRFHYQLPETKEEMQKIKKIANQYINQTLNLK